jgi:hypothetical protein
MNSKFKILIVIALLILSYGIYQYYSFKKIEVIETIGATVEKISPPLFKFTDITSQSGIDFVQENSAYGDKLLPETMGTGVAAVDIDNDNDIDIIFVSATRWPWLPDQGQQPSVRVFLNDGTGKFKAGNYAGLKHSFYAVGIAVADVDNNGYKDIYVTALGANHLYLNDGKDFIESAKLNGVSGSDDSWSTGTSFFDFDNDGDLDLVYGNYVKWNKQLDIDVNYSLTGIGKSYGPPTDFSASSLKLFQNNGVGIFTDVSIQSGIASQLSGENSSGYLQGKSLVVQPLDIDDDGALDIFVANDTTRNFLFHNLRNGKFSEQGEILGVAYDGAGHATGAMGVDVGYFGKNNEQIIAVGNFSSEMTSYYLRYPKQQYFSELSVISGIGPSSRKSLTFGVLFVDLDNDGREDLFQVNGHVENNINQVQSSQQYRQPPQLFWNCGELCNTRFIPTEVFSKLALVARGVAYADFDNDGDSDLVITQVADKAILLRNDTTNKNRWLRLQLNQSGSNKEAIGAQVTMLTNSLKKKKLVMPTRGYLSQSETTITFIIPESESQILLQVIWPDRTQSEYKVSQFNHEMILTKGSHPE